MLTPILGTQYSFLSNITLGSHAPVIYPQSLTDTLFFTDRATGVAFHLKPKKSTLTETLTTSLNGSANSIDFLDSTVDYDFYAARTVNDSLVLVDTLTYTTVDVASLSDSLSLSDQATFNLVASYTFNNSLTLSDQVNCVFITNPTLNDSLTLTDSLVLNLLVNLFSTDSLSLSQTLTFSTNNSASLTDSLVLNDSIFYVQIFGRLLSDTLTLSDSSTYNLGNNYSLNDSLILTSLVTSTSIDSRLLSSILSLTDSITLQRNPLYSFNDTLSLSQTILSPYSVTSILTLTQQVSRVVTLSLSVPDQLFLNQFVTVKKVGSYSFEFVAFNRILELPTPETLVIMPYASTEYLSRITYGELNFLLLDSIVGKACRFSATLDLTPELRYELQAFVNYYSSDEFKLLIDNHIWAARFYGPNVEAKRNQFKPSENIVTINLEALPIKV